MWWLLLLGACELSVDDTDTGGGGGDTDSEDTDTDDTDTDTDSEDTDTDSEDTDTDTDDTDTDTDDTGEDLCGNALPDTGETCDLGNANTDTACEVVPGDTSCSYCSTSCEEVVVQGVGDVTGMVLDASRTDWLGLPGATVVAPDGTSAITGADGTFTLSGVPAGEQVVLTVEGPAFDATYANEGYGTGIVLARVGHAETTVVSARLIAACAITQPIDGTEGGVFALNADSGCPGVPDFSAGEVTVEPGDLQREDGTPYVGDLRVELAPMSLHTGEGSVDWRMFTAVPGTGTTRAVVSGLEVRLLDAQTGDLVLVAPSETLLVKAPSNGNNDSSLTRTARRWDSTTLDWVGDTSVVDYDSQPGFEASTAGIWQVHNDAPASRGCVRGRVVDAAGDAVPSISVRTSDRAGVLLDATVGRDGTFCGDGEAGDELYIELRGGEGAQQRLDLYSPISFTGSCDAAPTDCEDLGDVVLPAPVTRCARLTLEDLQGTPVSGRELQARAYSRGYAYLIEAAGTTDAQGEACLEFTNTEDYGYVELLRADGTTCSASGPTLSVDAMTEGSCANASACAHEGTYITCD